jgi:hypothetical protein
MVHMTRKRQTSPPVPQQTGRLCDVRQAAAYLGLGVWTIRDLIHSGYLARIALPSTRRPGETIRRILVDRADLDLLIDRFRETADPYRTEARDRVLNEHFAPNRTPRKSHQATQLTHSAGNAPTVARTELLAPLGKAPDVNNSDVRQPVKLEGDQGDYWCRVVRNSVDANGLFRCCMKQIVYFEEQRGPKVRNGTELTCPFCQTDIEFRGIWQNKTRAVHRSKSREEHSAS